MWFDDDENPWSAWVSRHVSGLFAHPGAPDGGSGFGYGRLPGPSGTGFASSDAPHPYSPAGRQITPWEAAVEYAKFELDRERDKISRSWSWAALRGAAERALGPKSFGLGACYGIVKNPAMSVVGLVQLQKMLIEADLYERLTGRVSWKIMLSASGLYGLPQLYEVGYHLAGHTGFMHLADLKRSYEMREALIKNVGEMIEHPIDSLGQMAGKLKASSIANWTRFRELQKQTDLRSQFEAGEIFGDVLMEVVMLVLTVISVAGAAAKLASKVPQLVRVAEFIKGARAAEAGGVAEEVGEAAEGAEVASDFAKQPLHNDSALAPEIEDGSFKPQREVHMDNLSPEENAAKEAMIEQGRDDPGDQRQLLKSGSNFETKPLKKGDKLYAFDTAGHNKPPDSMYWLDEEGYVDVKSKYCKEGVWDREGVKNELALPCYNRANTVVQSEVLADHTAISSDIAPATERVCYSGDSFTTGMYTKPMPGGGTQITPSAANISTPKILPATP